MRSILRRLVLVFKVRLAALLSSAEDPRQVFELANQRQQELLDKVRQARARIARAKDQLEAKTAEARVKLLQLDEQARAAVTAGRDDVARFVLHRRVAGGDELDGLERQVTEIEHEERELTLVEQRLEAQIETFFARREVIAARYSTAEAHVEVREALGGVSDELAGLGTALERAEQTTDRMQARASALDHLAELGVLDDPGDRLEDDSAPVETGGSRSEVVEAKLASLKREASAG